MCKEVFKIGQEVEILENSTVETFGGKILNLCQGDLGIINSEGQVTLTSGEGKGKIIDKSEDAEMIGYDHYNLANRIYRLLCNNYGIDSYVRYEELSSKDIIDDIEHELIKLL